MKANGASKFRNINQLKENSEYFESFQPRVEKVSADSSPLMFFRGNVAAVHCFIHLLLSLPPALLNSITSQLSCVLSLGRLQSLTIFATSLRQQIQDRTDLIATSGILIDQDSVIPQLYKYQGVSNAYLL